MINHYNAVRLRVTGSGDLKMTLYSLSEAKSFPLTDLTMSASTYKTETKRANFKQERAYLDIRVEEIDEYFVIDSITVFAKPIAESYPL